VYPTGWNGSGNGIPQSTGVWVLAVDPNLTTTVFAGTDDGGFYVSKDSGATWTTPASWPPSADDPMSICIDPTTNPSTVYVLDDNMELVKSTDGGATWKVSASTAPFTYNPGLYAYYGAAGAAMAIDGGSPRTLYIYSDVLYASHDGGITWVPGVAISTAVTEVNCLAADPFMVGVVYVGTDQGVFTTKDGGRTWFQGAAGQNVSSLAADSVTAGVVFAGTTGDAIFQSRNRGWSWTKVASFTPPPNPGMSVMGILGVGAIAIDPTSSLVVYAGTDASGGAVMKSKDGGATWAPATSHLTDPVAAMAIDPSQTTTVYAGVDVYTGQASVYKSTTGGE
jgi:photosystem II stability/assembly factor-like uncharacterized protein